MTEEKGEVKAEKKEGEKKEERGQKVVTLSEVQYAALLDRVAELESVPFSRAKEVYNIDELAEEGRGKGKGVKEEEEEVDWEDLSNKELVGKVVGVLNQTGLKLQTQIETLKVLREIDKAERDHDDFWEYEKKVREISMENPALSIEDAYQLAKTKSPVKKKEGEKEKEKGERTTKTEKLLNLPSRGDSLGVVSSSTKGSEIKTLKEAANKAWDEVVGKGKTVIE